MNQIDLFGNVVRDESLKSKFGIIPFSVLDTKSAEWKTRKAKWVKLGIQSELGRSDDLLGFKRIYSKGKERLFDRDTSIFDPVLTELMYDWFCVPNGKILDPFAGGSVRGVVAAYRDYAYTGIELRAEQVQSNKEQSDVIFRGTEISNLPIWIQGDSYAELDNLSSEYDMVFTCPPYFDLEVYSDDPKDISNMNFEDFINTYKAILQKSCALLKQNRFFCIVIGDVRDKDRTINWYRNLIGLTKQFVIEAGLHLYNDIILLDNIGSSAMRVEQAFTKRKLVKIHQNVIVFYKGDNVNDIRDEFHK